MAAIPKLNIVFIAIALIVLAVFIHFSLQIHRRKGAALSWRGIIKLISLNGVPENLAALYPKWFIAFWALFVSVSATVACIVWGTDHSFLIVIFPLLFYYFFARYFLWEKADLTD